MFFISVCLGENNDYSGLAVVRKTLKNVKNHYHIEDIILFPPEMDYSEVENKIISLFKERKFSINKRVFSQDRRPARNIKAPPTLLINFKNDNTSKIDRMRENNISVEGICFRKGETWEKQDYKSICLGNNYYVSEQDVVKALLAVFQENRLTIKNDVSYGNDISGILEKISEETQSYSTVNILREKHGNIISALSMPIWFRETIRIIRRY